MAEKKNRDKEIAVEEAEETVEAEVKIESPAKNEEPDLGEPVAWGSGGQFIKRNGKYYRA